MRTLWKPTNFTARLFANVGRKLTSFERGAGDGVRREDEYTPRGCERWREER